MVAGSIPVIPITSYKGGLSNWLARRPVKPLPAGHVGSSPSPPNLNTNFTFPSNSVGESALEVGGSNPSSGTTFERMVAQLAEAMVLGTIKCEFESHSSDILNLHITSRHDSVEQTV